MIPFEKYICQFGPPSKMAAVTKYRNFFKWQKMALSFAEIS
jgi:hypothetical protein